MSAKWHEQKKAAPKRRLKTRLTTCCYLLELVRPDGLLPPLDEPDDEPELDPDFPDAFFVGFV